MTGLDKIQHIIHELQARSLPMLILNDCTENGILAKPFLDYIGGNKNLNRFESKCLGMYSQQITETLTEFLIDLEKDGVIIIHDKKI